MSHTGSTRTQRTRRTNVGLRDRDSVIVCRWGSLPFAACLSPTDDRSALPVDVFESDEAITIEGSAPGVGREDVEITVADTVITIHVRPHPAPRHGHGRYLRRERFAGGWSRTIELPTPVAANSMAWDLEQGVLTLRIAKHSEYPLPTTGKGVQRSASIAS